MWKRVAFSTLVAIHFRLSSYCFANKFGKFGLSLVELRDIYAKSLNRVKPIGKIKCVSTRCCNVIVLHPLGLLLVELRDIYANLTKKENWIWKIGSGRASVRFCNVTALYPELLEKVRTGLVRRNVTVHGERSLTTMVSVIYHNVTLFPSSMPEEHTHDSVLLYGRRRIQRAGLDDYYKIIFLSTVPLHEAPMQRSIVGLQLHPAYVKTITRRAMVLHAAHGVPYARQCKSWTRSGLYLLSFSIIDQRFDSTRAPHRYERDRNRFSHRTPRFRAARFMGISDRYPLLFYYLLFSVQVL